MAPPPTLLFVALLLCTHGMQVSWSQCLNSTALSIQVDSLLAEYDREAMPPTTEQFTIEVTLDIKHANIDQEHSVMKLLADLNMVWVDKRIRWNMTEWGCDYAITAAERLWLPDVMLVNAAATGVTNAPSDVGLRARIDNNGAVTWAMRLDLAAPLELQLYDWPYDTQRCVFKFASRAYNIDQMELIVHGVESVVVFESGTWEIESLKGDTSEWARGSERVSVAHWAVELRRRAPAHALAASTVLVAGALLLAAALALPPDQRHALAACASFTAALWLVCAPARLGGAASCPRVVSLMAALCACGAAACACAALVRRVARVSAPPPRLLRAALSALSAVCRLTPSSEECDTSESGAWAAASVLADRALGAALLLTLAVLLAIQLL